MKPQELRIGNLVNNNCKVVKVEQTTKHKIGYHTKPNETRMNYARLCEIEPIPITDELLFKNGFTDNVSNLIIPRLVSVGNGELCLLLQPGKLNQPLFKLFITTL